MYIQITSNKMCLQFQQKIATENRAVNFRTSVLASSVKTPAAFEPWNHASLHQPLSHHDHLWQPDGWCVSELIAQQKLGKHTPIVLNDKPRSVRIKVNDRTFFFFCFFVELIFARRQPSPCEVMNGWLMWQGYGANQFLVTQLVAVTQKAWSVGVCCGAWGREGLWT